MLGLFRAISQTHGQQGGRHLVGAFDALGPSVLPAELVSLVSPPKGTGASLAAAITMGVLLLLVVLAAILMRRAERRRMTETLEQAAQKVRALTFPVRDDSHTRFESGDACSSADGGTSDKREKAVPLMPSEVDALVAAARDALGRARRQGEAENGEARRNQLLAAEISRFYAHVRVLNGESFRIDFFEYHAEPGRFVFLTGLATLFGVGSQIFREMEDVEFFPRFACSLSDSGVPGALPARDESDRTRKQFVNAARESLKTGDPFMMEFRAFSEEDGYLWLRCWGRPDAAGRKIDGAMLDITREVGQREADRNRFHYDNITGFLNRNALTEVAGRVLDTRAADEVIAFVYFGLRRYGDFEARFGMMAGNSYIRAFSDLLRENMTDRTTLFRWWGPNFLCIVRGMQSVEEMHTLSEQMISRISSQQRMVDGIAAEFPVSAGYAIAGRDGETPAELLEHAAFAKHETEGNTIVLIKAFDKERFDSSRQVMLRRSFIRDVINRNELYMVYQPIVSLRTADVYGFEALSRPANSMYRNIVELIGDAEDTGHYAILEKRMVYNALDGYMERPDAYKDAWLFVNTSPVPALTETDYHDIRERYFSFMRVVYEVTERSRIDPDEMARRKAIVRESGAQFALDDFGSGFANHLALLALEPDIIKIDQGIVRHVDQDVRKQQMLEDIIAYARLGGTRVLAEGVETKGELQALCRMGVDLVQGFYLGRPDVVFSGVSPEAVAVIQGMSRALRPTPALAVGLALETLTLRSPELARQAIRASWITLALATAWGMAREEAMMLSLSGVLLGLGAMLDDEGAWQTTEGHEAVRRLRAAGGLSEVFLEDWPFHQVFRRRFERAGEGSPEAWIVLLAEKMALQTESENPLALSVRYAEILTSMPWGPVKMLANTLPRLAEEVCEPFLRERYSEMTGDLPEERALTEGLLRLLACAVDSRSPYLSGHALQMEKAAEMLSHMLKQGWQLSERIRLAALCGNLGNITVPSALIDRQGRLSAEELALVRTRGERSRRLLEGAGMMVLADLQPRLPESGAASERNAEKNVAMGRAILSVSDILAALLQERAWRHALSLQQAGAVLTDMAASGLVDTHVAEIAVENLPELAAELLTVSRSVREKLWLKNTRLHVVSGGAAGERKDS